MHFQSSTQWQRQQREACEEIRFYFDIVIFAFTVVTGACDPNMTVEIFTSSLLIVLPERAP